MFFICLAQEGIKAGERWCLADKSLNFLRGRRELASHRKALSLDIHVESFVQP
jgi:hypothetical protein